MDKYGESLEKFLDSATNFPHILFNEYDIKEFIVSKSWVYQFMMRHNLVFRKPHKERRGKIDAIQFDNV